MTNAHAHPDTLAGEDGSVSLLSLIVIFTFLLLICTVVNTGWEVTRKLETQNSSDATANAAAVEMARGMNAVTAANHLMGELMALVVLHHGLGGYELDGVWTPRKSDPNVKQALQTAYEKANDSPEPPDPMTYNCVSQDPRVGGAIGDARETLQKLLAQAYTVHALGGILDDLVVTSELGVALVAVAQAFEAKIMQEWTVLEFLEQGVAVPLLTLKLALQDAVVPALYGYTQTVVKLAPLNAEAAAQSVAAGAGATVTLFPSPSPVGGGPTLALPVAQEPLLLFPLKSQLVRATAPWMKCWRQPVMIFGYLTLTLCQFSQFYQDWTDKFILTKAYELKRMGVNLYVMQDLFTAENGFGAQSDKGSEPWTRPTPQGSQRADQLFCLMAIARRDPAPVTKVSVFRPNNPGGIVTYSQAMTYNANPQKPSLPGWQVTPAAQGSVPSWAAPLPSSLDQFNQELPQLTAGWNTLTGIGNQPNVGWDTLNWNAQVPEATNFVVPDPGAMFSMAASPPQVCLNWQAKLVPTTRLSESALYLPSGPLSAILGRLGPGPRTLDNTH
jgi:hypothetical protein